MQAIKCEKWICVVAIAGVLCGGRPASAQQGTAIKKLAEQSLPLRTALHKDPSLGAPLERLVQMYRKANQVDALLTIYQSHLRSYPNDVRATTVLVRLLAALKDPQTLGTVRRAVQRFPDNSFLQFTLFRILRADNDPKALDSLDKAILLEKIPARRFAWIDQLLPLAQVEGRIDLVKKHLERLGKIVTTPTQQLAVAKRMLKFKLPKMAFELLSRKLKSAPAPETMVGIELALAKSEAELNKKQDAAKRLDKLLDKLTADYWQRNEILQRRLALVDSAAEREAMIAAAKELVKKRPTDEAAALDLARLMIGLQRRRDALVELLKAGKRLPKSVAIEKQILDLVDRLHDEHGRVKYLSERVKAQPERQDLQVALIRSQFQLARRKEAETLWKALSKKLDKDTRVREAIEMARFLRRSGLMRDAVIFFDEAVQGDPSRLDVKRELAECLIATGDRERIRLMIDKDLPEDASAENLMDLVQFLLRQKLFVEARRLLNQRLKKDEENLEVRMLLVEVQRRLGSVSKGKQLIEKTRALADTGARYRAWIEGAIGLHEEYDTVDRFLAAELGRLQEETGEWTAARVERRLVFTDVAIRNKYTKEAAALLEQDLQSPELVAKHRVRLRRQLIRLLTEEKATGDILMSQLKELAKDDPQYIHESKARLAVMHAAGNRMDLARPLLEQIKIDRIQDPVVLSDLRPLMRGMDNGVRKELAVLQRLTFLNPTDRDNWEEWILALAMGREEDQLRRVLRRILSGVEKMALTDESRSMLEGHLVDSYWRSISTLVAQRESWSDSECLLLIDSVERHVRDDTQWLWIAWIRGYLLNRLKRSKERDEAIRELERVVARLNRSADPKSKKPIRPTELRIGFPDGLSTSLKYARDLLTSHKELAPIRLARRTGPLPGFATKWMLRANKSATFVSILPAPNGLTILLDSQGSAFCVRDADGKLQWTRRHLFKVSAGLKFQSMPRSPGGPSYMMPVRQATMSLVSPVAVGDDKLIVPGKDSISCFVLSTGRHLWKAEVGAIKGEVKSQGTGAYGVTVLTRGNEVVTYEPLSGTVTRINIHSGKIVWDARFDSQRQVIVTPSNSGASLDGDKLMVYGSQPAIIDLKSGKVLWSFNPFRVRRFPVKLKDPNDDAEEPESQTTAFSPPAIMQPIAYSSRVLSSRFGSRVVMSPSGRTMQRMGLQPPVHSRLGRRGAFRGSVPPSSYPAARRPTTGRPIAVKNTEFVSYLDPGQAVKNDMKDVRLAPPAVVWAGLGQNGSPRRAILNQDWLILMQADSFIVMRTDVPIAGRRVAVKGKYIGMTGRHICIKDGNLLQLVHVTSGEIQRVDLGGLAAASEHVNAFMDGPIVYATGTKGVWGIHSVTGTRVFSAPWPNNVIELLQDATPNPASSNMMPVTRCRVRDGMLYTVLTPGLVVALSGVTDAK